MSISGLCQPVPPKLSSDVEQLKQQYVPESILSV